MKLIVLFIAVFALQAEASSWYECEGCKAVAAAAQELLKSQSVQSDVIGWVNDLCKDLPTSLQSTCTTGIQQYGPEIFQKLADLLDPTSLCTSVGFCDASSKHLTFKQVAATKSLHGAECELCEWAVGIVDKEIQSSGVLTKILAYLSQVCSALPSSMATECQSIVTNYGQQIINKIMQILTPATACADAGMCTATREMFPVGTAIGCDICKGVFAELDQLLTSEEPQILAWAQNACKGLPTSLQSECDALMTQYGKQVIDGVIAQLKPETICTEVKACSSKMTLSLGGECKTCKAVVQQVDNIIENESSNIMSGFDQLCAQFGPLESSCKQFVQSYGQKLIDLLTGAMSPDNVCKGVHVC